MNEQVNEEQINEEIDKSDYGEETRHRRPDCRDDGEPSPRAQYQLLLAPPAKVLAGSDAFIVVDVIPPLGHVYVSPVVSKATETLYTYGSDLRGDLIRLADGRYQLWVNTPPPANARFGVRLKGLPQGTHGIDITVKTGNVSQTAHCVISVVYAPATHPRYTKWLAQMQKLAPKWSDPNFTYSFGVEQQVWYYDGARVYFQVADYLNEPKYLDTAYNIARQYRDYVLSATRGVPGYRVFTRGFRMAFERSGDESYRKAVFHQASTMYAVFGGSPYDAAIRETAYALNALVDADRLGMPRTSMMARCVENLLSVFDIIFVSKTYSLHQTFFDGLAMEALIDYYELTGDRRVITAVQLCCDWMIANAITPDGKLIVNPEPKGPKCEWGCQLPDTQLINLTVTAFAWLWMITGDEKYRDNGDLLFAHNTDFDISYSGKIFSQNYKWSFNFLKYRDAR